MKKLLCLTCALLLALTSGATDRNNILKVYNWADYIDESVIPEFEEWYKEQTGEEVQVVYQLFDVNEIMLSKIEHGKEDFDVVCPSEYIIERMLRNDLLLPIKKDFGQTPNYIDSNLSPYIISCFNKIDGSGKNANDYAVGYMWGTTGIMYNTKYVQRDEVSSWGAFTNPKFKGKLFMKDAFRDVYSTLLTYLRQEDLKSGKITLDELMYDASDESIALVENYIKSFKDAILGWEVDFGKEMMCKEKAYINFTWSGDATWAMEEAAEVGISLDYVVPQEGSNVWFDGWVIPKYAKNIKAASYFINFMCRDDIAIRNMDEIGYVSAIATPKVLEENTDEKYDPINVSYFFGEGADSIQIDPVHYPAFDVIQRCAMMHDSGERTEAMLAMWERVKGDNATASTYICVSAIAALLIVYLIIRKKKAKGHHQKAKRR